MKKNLFYYFLAVSIILHLLIILSLRLESPQKKKKEPIVVDVVGPLNWGPKTVLPAGKKPPETKTAALTPPKRHVAGRALRQLMPAIPQRYVPPVPRAARAQRPSPAPAGPPPSPGSIASPAPPGRGGTAKAQAATAPPQPRGASGHASAQSGRHGLILPSERGLEKYAKADTEGERQLKGGDTITLDTEDLMYTSYLQSLKRRIELIWKYPETARRDRLQGSLIMKFCIGKSGKLEDVEILRSSGYPMLDEAAKQALWDANPYNPLPGSWKKDSFTITGTFVYKIYGLYGKPYLE